MSSSAIDAGNDATCATTDQRGISRPQGAHCDIGAYEMIPTTFNKLSPSNGTTNGSLTPTLTWTASGGATYYEVCGDTSNDGVCSGWIYVGGATSVAIPAGYLFGNTTYYWQVRAYSAGGVTYANGSSSAYWSFKTGGPPAPFGKVSPGNGATNVSLTPTLMWTASSGASYYQVCGDTSNDGTCANWITVGNVTSLAVPAGYLSRNTTYYWQVRAYNAKGRTYADGSSSAYWSVKTVP